MRKCVCGGGGGWNVECGQFVAGSVSVHPLKTNIILTLDCFQTVLWVVITFILSLGSLIYSNSITQLPPLHCIILLLAQYHSCPAWPPAFTLMLTLLTLKCDIRDSQLLLTHSMVQSPSWEGNWFPASQEIPRTSRNPKVHHRTHKRPPPVSILGQPNPVHIPTSHLLEIHPNIIPPSTPRSPQWSLSLRFPPARPYTPPSHHPYAPHDQPISFFLILSPAQYWVGSTNHLAPLYAVSSIPRLPCTS
jgi:hypothetical protein